MRVRNSALLAAIALTVLGIAACNTTTTTVTHTVTQPASPTGAANTETDTGQASPTTPANGSGVPVLSPGGSATFSLGSTASSQVSKMTWTMGSHVATAPDNFQGPGFQDIAFNLTVRNDGAEMIDGGGGGAQSNMVWRGTDGRTDYTLASTAATEISAGTQGITGHDLALVSGIPANGYATGYLALLVPTSPGAVVVVDPNTFKPVLVINYDKLTADQVNALKHGLRQVRQNRGCWRLMGITTVLVPRRRYLGPAGPLPLPLVEDDAAFEVERCVSRYGLVSLTVRPSCLPWGFSAVSGVARIEPPTLMFCDLATGELLRTRKNPLSVRR